MMDDIAASELTTAAERLIRATEREMHAAVFGNAGRANPTLQLPGPWQLGGEYMMSCDYFARAPAKLKT